MLPTAGVSALVSAVLCPFVRTAKQAYRLSRVALWSGAIAFVVALVATLVTAGWPDSAGDAAARRQKTIEAAIFITLTGVGPLIAFFTGRLSRRKMVTANESHAV